MKTTTTFFIGIALLLGSFTSVAQVGLNNPNPDPSSILDVKSSDKGILIPRMTTGQRNAMAIGIPTPAQGLLVFDTNLNRIYFWDGSKWRAANVVSADSTGANEVARVATRMSVGSTYSSKEPASNGLIVEGNTGLGTDDPNGNKLKVTGTTHLNGNTTVTGDVTVTGKTTTNTATVTGTLTANDYAHTGSNKNGPIPSGGIIMWSGSNASIPTGWALCDGSNGTPDLRNRFIVGSGGAYSTGNTGGDTIHTHTMNASGGHTHSLPANTGGITGYNPSGSYPQPYFAQDDGGNCNSPTWASGNYLETSTGGCQEGQHGHLLGGNTGTDGNHTHNVTSSNHLPPYYALAFIMKL